VGNRQTSLTLPGDARAAGLARRHLTHELNYPVILVGDLLDHALILVSELVANAVTHGTGTLHIDMAVMDGWLRLEVHDESPDLPRLRKPTVDDDHGRGLLIVDTLADEWGIRATAAGKAVWCDMALH
jgi:anti-sigma regulatory factor (Ser/Thr protein kinase)